jgi:hypothetical protein
MQKLIPPTDGDWVVGQFASAGGCGVAVYPSAMQQVGEPTAPVCVMAPGSSGNPFDMANAKLIAQAKNLRDLLQEYMEDPDYVEGNHEFRARAKSVLVQTKHYVDEPDPAT